MDWNRVEGNWKQLKGKAKQQWGRLTDDDLTRAAGRREELAGRVQERYGLAKDAAQKQVDEWASKANDSWFTKQ
ncbi:MAG TPA: CsbD family protein [Steroidobacteraceae bacterium]|nr:CsbD family protein [Steroidobacteraceae bacterium]